MSSAVNQRLHALIAHVYPDAAAQHDLDGTWPTRTGGDPANREHGVAPFVIDTLADGRMRVRLTSADGDTVVAIIAGAFIIAGALHAIATKLHVEG